MTPIARKTRWAGGTLVPRPKAAQELVATSYRETYGLPLATACAGNVIEGRDWAEDRVLAEARKAMSVCSHVIHLVAIVGGIATTSSPTR